MNETACISEFKTGDGIKLMISKNRSLDCVVYINKNQIFLCSNSRNYNEMHNWNLFHKKFRCKIQLIDNQYFYKDKLLCLRKFVKISDKLDKFLGSNYKKYKPVFNNNKFTSNYLSIEEPKTENKEGFIILNSINKKIIKIKLGRLMRKLILEHNKINESQLPITDEIIEGIHNKWVSYINDVTYEFAVGDDILKGYTQKYYAKNGSLKSCMTGKFNQLLLYTTNADKIKLMILYFQGEVCGRALVWKCDDDKIYHDRIYTSFDWVKNKMLDIFKKENIINAFGAGLTLKVTLNAMEGITHPYLDTFRFKDYRKKCLSTTNLIEK